MASPSIANSPIAPREAPVEKDGIKRDDTRLDSAVHTDGELRKDEDATHSGSSDTEQPPKEFKEGGYGW